MDNKIIIQFYDEGNTFGLIKVNKKYVARIKSLLEMYKERHCDMVELRIEEFYRMLEKDKIGFEILKYKVDEKIYF